MGAHTKRSAVYSRRRRECPETTNRHRGGGEARAGARSGCRGTSEDGTLREHPMTG